MFETVRHIVTRDADFDSIRQLQLSGTTQNGICNVLLDLIILLVLQSEILRCYITAARPSLAYKLLVSKKHYMVAIIIT